MMTETNLVYLHELFLCGGMGFLLGGVYDLFRALRLCTRNAVFTFAVDTAYCLLAGLAGFLFCLAVTDGMVRAYVLAGFVIGFFAYRFTVGKTLLYLMKWTKRGIGIVVHGIKRRFFCKKTEKPQKKT